MRAARKGVVAYHCGMAAFRDDERHADFRRANAEARMKWRCGRHPIAYADGTCDACKVPMCGACLLMPITGGTLCPSCLDRHRVRRFRARRLLLGSLVLVSAIGVGLGLFGISRTTAWRDGCHCEAYTASGFPQICY